MEFFLREELRQTLAQVLVHLVDEFAGQKEFQEALSYARRWLLLDPWHELAHRRLMELYARAGQEAAALRQYNECVRILSDNLNVSHTEETTALYKPFAQSIFQSLTERQIEQHPKSQWPH